MIRLACLLAVMLSTVAYAHGDHGHQPPWQAATLWPDRIIVTHADDPATSFSVTWRTNIAVGVAVAEIAAATSDARFDLNATTRRAHTTPLPLAVFDGPDGEVAQVENAGLPNVHFHSVTFTDLEPDTLYAYRVRGERGYWSAWRQLRTAPSPDTDQPLEFLFFGDAQTGIRSHVTRIFDTAARVAPEARFAIHGGDLVNTAFYDREWAEWFSALGRTAVTLPAVPVSGNHDYVNFDRHLGRKEGKLFEARKRVSPLWRPQFALPVEDSLPDDLAETVYDLRYGPVHVFVLDSSGVAWDEQLRWFEAGVRGSDADWIILTMHHPLFSFIGGNEHPASRERRLALLRTLERVQPHLLLTGHRHTYQRGRYGDDVARFGVGEPHDIKTVFLTTASSTKRGEGKTEGWQRYSDETDGDWALTRPGDNTPIFAVARIEDNGLTVRAVDAVGDVYDAFRIEQFDQKRRLIDLSEAAQPVNTYENTGSYRAWDDLR